MCRLFAFSTDGPNRCLLLELCSGGALDTRLRCRAVSAAAAPPAPLQWRHRLRIALDIARALAHLHSQEPPILHRDMKVKHLRTHQQLISLIHLLHSQYSTHSLVPRLQTCC